MKSRKIFYIMDMQRPMIYRVQKGKDMDLDLYKRLAKALAAAVAGDAR